MFGKLLGSVVELTSNVASVALAPVAIVTDVAVAVTKPVADMAKDLAKETKEALRD